MSKKNLPHLQGISSTFITQISDVIIGKATLAVLVWVVLALSSAQVVLADAWVERMLAVREHDFGTVMIGTDAVYRFAVKNVYKHEIVLVGVRSSCGCTSAALDNKRLQPGDVGFLVADFNTRTFSGLHDSTLTLEASWEDNGVRRTGEAAVNIRGTIRGHVTVEPNEIHFANVEAGSAPQQNVRISTTGDPKWSVKNVQCSCQNIDVRVPEPFRSPEQVIYNLLVQLNARTPPGHIHEQLVVIPTDAAEPRIPLQVSGRVVPDLWVAPDSLFLGEVAAGGHASKKLMVRSRKPCRILSVKSGSTDFEFHAAESASNRQILEVIFQAGNEVGPLKKPITIATDSGDSTSVTAYADVVDATLQLKPNR